MKQARILLALSFLLSMTTNMAAENVIQAIPLTANAGLTPDDAAYISFEMTNEEANIVGIEFFVKLPDGISFDDSALEEYPPFELVLDRFPYTGRTNNKQYQHSLNYAKDDDGWWHIIISSTQLNPIKELSGEIMRGYFVTDASLQPGVYPVSVKGAKLAISGSQKAETADVASSYVVIGDESPLLTEANVDMSALTGYVPSFVVEAMNEELAQNGSLVSLNLSGATELGGELQMAANTLWYTANAAGLNRTLPASQWSTVCLPFGLSSEQTATLKEAGMEIEQLSDFDGTTVTFASTDNMEANKPYIVKCTTEQSPFAALQEVSVEGLNAASIASGTLTMKGVYEKTTLNSDESATYYSFNAADGEFVRIGKNGTILPFRAYLQNNGAASSRLRVVHADGTAGIGSTKYGAAGCQTLYNLQGLRLQDEGSAKGIYIQHGKKIINQ